VPGQSPARNARSPRPTRPCAKLRANLGQGRCLAPACGQSSASKNSARLSLAAVTSAPKPDALALASASSRRRRSQVAPRAVTCWSMVRSEQTESDRRHFPRASS
jgi:hypothetical protein